MDTKFGYKRDPISLKDLDFTKRLEPSLMVATPTGDVDLSRYATDTNQLSISSCAGNATADSIEVLCAIEEERLSKASKLPPAPPVQLSRLFVYSMARALMDSDGDGQGDLDKDEGTYIRLCFDTLSRFGICDEKVWPYDVRKVFTAPSIKSIRQAVGHRIHSYYRINEVGKGRVDAVIKALRANHPVVFGTLIDQSFMATNGDPVIGVPDSQHIVGGHAMAIVGYVRGNFKVKNSWGPRWREGGYCYFTPEYLTWANTWDLWVPTMGSNFKR